MASSSAVTLKTTSVCKKKSANLFNFLIADVKIPIDQSLFFLAVIDLALKEVVNILRLGIAH
jgi:hypothetical protein